MTGSAIHTPIRPDRPNPFADEAIYEVFPLLEYPGGETAYLLASSCLLSGDTGVFPADESGHVLEEFLMGCVPGADHGRALRSVGYEREVVTRARS